MSDKQASEQIAQKLAIAIKRERKRIKKSQEKLAWAAGLSSRWVESAEAGKIGNPKVLSLLAVSKVLGVNFHKLIREIIP